MAIPAQTLNFCGVLSESKRIVNAHSRHFLALSVFFLVPLSFSLFIYPTVQSTLSSPSSGSVNTQFLLRVNLTIPDHHSLKTLALPLFFSLFLYFLSLCAVATITYSTFHGFYGRPVKLLSAIKSLLYSFIPLISTSIVSLGILMLICVLFFSFLAIGVKGFETLGFEVDYNSNYFMGICAILAILLGSVLIYFQVNWALAPVIVVAESKWGIQPLRRSSHLLKGMRSVSLSLLLFFGALTWFIVWPNSSTLSSGFYERRTWVFILQTVFGSSFLTILLLHHAASNTVLYMYCKALQGELAFEIVEEFAREYVSLPFDDEKLPRVVTVVED